jgi:hypothetical protein
MVMTPGKNMQGEHLKNISRGLTFEASEQPAAEIEKDERPEPKVRVRRHPNRKRVV